MIGTSSGRNPDFLRELGVDEAIDYTTNRFDEVVQDADLALVTIGGEVLERTWRVLKPGCFLVSLVEAPSEETAAAHGVRGALVSRWRTGKYWLRSPTWWMQDRSNRLYQRFYP